MSDVMIVHRTETAARAPPGPSRRLAGRRTLMRARLRDPVCGRTRCRSSRRSAPPSIAWVLAVHVFDIAAGVPRAVGGAADRPRDGLPDAAARRPAGRRDACSACSSRSPPGSAVRPQRALARPRHASSACSRAGPRPARRDHDGGRDGARRADRRLRRRRRACSSRGCSTPASGSRVGLLVNLLVWPPLRDRAAAHQIDVIDDRIGELLRDMAGALRRGPRRGRRRLDRPHRRARRRHRAGVERARAGARERAAEPAPRGARSAMRAAEDFDADPRAARAGGRRDAQHGAHDPAREHPARPTGTELPHAVARAARAHRRRGERRRRRRARGGARRPRRVRRRARPSTRCPTASGRSAARCSSTCATSSRRSTPSPTPSPSGFPRRRCPAFTPACGRGCRRR